jgi:hypothetical protein
MGELLGKGSILGSDGLARPTPRSVEVADDSASLSGRASEGGVPIRDRGDLDGSGHGGARGGGGVRVEEVDWRPSVSSCARLLPAEREDVHGEADCCSVIEQVNERMSRFEKRRERKTRLARTRLEPFSSAAGHTAAQPVMATLRGSPSIASSAVTAATALPGAPHTPPSVLLLPSLPGSQPQWLADWVKVGRGTLVGYQLWAVEQR